MNQAKSIKILVAEDHEIVRDGICALVGRQEDLEVIAQATNGEEAVRLYKEYRPDLLLTDLKMPVMEGVKAIEQIIANHPQAKIIILTTYDTDEDIYRGLKAGAKGYLLKDTSSQELATAIRTVNKGQKYIPERVVARLTERIGNSELTKREMDVLKLLTNGNTNQEIGAILKITEGTVKFHVNNIFTKLDVSDRTQAVITAFKKGLARLE